MNQMDDIRRVELRENLRVFSLLAIDFEMKRSKERSKEKNKERNKLRDL